MAGTITIEGNLTGTTIGTVKLGPFTLVPDMNSNFEAISLTLASGANTIAVPSFATMIGIVPPTTNTVALTLKGVTGDTGVVISPDQATWLSMPASPPANFVLTAASGTSAPTSIVFA